MANLECRMFQNRYPRIGDLVMIKVDSIDALGASVSLLEYDNMEGIIDDSSCRDITVVGRIQPVRVLRVDRRVDVPNVFILLSSPSSVPSYLGDDHVWKFDKNRFVQTILREVARIRGCDLEEVHSLTGWVSYENLTDRDSAFWNIVSPDLNAQLVEMLDLIVVQSWRLMRPSLLNLKPVRVHRRIILCWAYALVRQFEAQLKLNELLGPDEYLSIQDLVDKCHEDLDELGDIPSLGDASVAMVYYGIVEERYVPLDFALNGPRRTTDENAVVYRVKEMKVVSDFDFETAEDWDSHILERVLIHPIACSVLWFDSYSQNEGGQGVFIPTAEELEAYEADPLAHHLPTHTMLLTGAVTHIDGRELWEFQDNTGDVNNGDRGFLYFARFPNPIIEHAQLVLED